MSEPFAYQPPSNGPEANYRPPGLFNRLVALIIDGLIVGIPTYIVGIILIFAGLPAFFLYLLIAAAATAYMVLLIPTRGTTIGKKAMGIAVATNPDGTGLASQAQAVKRYWGYSGAPLILLYILPGFLGSVLGGLAVTAWAIFILVTIFSSPIKRGWYDKYAGTWVIDTKANAGYGMQQGYAPPPQPQQPPQQPPQSPQF